ncbi:hypothetical protein SDC9_181322 [bioreactor metagenome]|uniref:Uncharacterized protein n=1 Tax=bioreactor metagenome TaxID=1076179 RepID=A0A645H562_9ZZZZ
MIELIIFHLHLLAGLYAFTKYWQQNGLKDAILALSVVALVFIVGWSIAGTIADVIYSESWKNPYFTKDALGLVILVIPESFFFYHFFVKDVPVENKVENQ